MPTLDSAVPLPPDEGDAGTARAASLQAHWERILEVLRGSIRREQFETWFRRAALVQLDATRLTLAVHNAFAREWLLDYYKDELAAAAEKALGAPRAIEIRVDPERVAALVPARALAPVEEPPPPVVLPPAPPPPSTPADPVADDDAGRLLGGSGVTRNPYYRFDNFVLGPCNRFAHAACQGVAEQPGKSYNPLFIHGNSGVGKTHLMQSLCHIVLDRGPRTRIL